MKKEYLFTISRTDRICLIVFVFLLLGWELIKYAIPLPNHEKEWMMQPISIHSDTNQEKDSLSGDDKKNTNQIQLHSERTEERADIESRYDPPVPILVNEATREELIKIGFSSKVAYNIRKYMDSGGVLRNEKDIMKIYGMDSNQWRAVSPFLLFPEENKQPAKTPWNPDKKEYVATPIDLNAATATELETLPGIGTILAERIIKYRTSLGGFLDVTQIQECYGLPPETYEKIAPRLIIGLPPTPIEINKVDMANFSHPYINKKMLGILKAYKKQHGPIMNAGDLRKIYPPDTTWCDRLLPYLVYN